MFERRNNNSWICCLFVFIFTSTVSILSITISLQQLHLIYIFSYIYIYIYIYTRVVKSLVKIKGNDVSVVNSATSGGPRVIYQPACVRLFKLTNNNQ